MVKGAFDASADVGEPGEILRRVAIELRADLDRITTRILREFATRIPATPDLTETVLVDVRRATRAALSAGLDRMADQAPREPIVEGIRRTAQYRASHGIPVEKALLGYEISAEVMLDEFASKLSTPSAGPVRMAALTLAGRRLLSFLQLATTEVTAGYQFVADARTTERDNDVQAYVEMLAGRRVGGPALAARVSRHGVGTLVRWVAATAPGAADDPAAVRAFRRDNPTDLIGRLDGRVLMFSDGEPPRLPGPFGVAAVTDEGSPSAVRRAARAADVAVHVGAHQVRGEDVEPLATLLELDPEVRAEFVRSCFGGLLTETRGPDLLATAATYLAEGMSTTAAARALNIHRHTLEYRLERIRALTGADLRDSFTRFRFEIALFLDGRLPGTHLRRSA